MVYNKPSDTYPPARWNFSLLLSARVCVCVCVCVCLGPLASTDRRSPTSAGRPPPRSGHCDQDQIRSIRMGSAGQAAVARPGKLRRDSNPAGPESSLAPRRGGAACRGSPRCVRIPATRGVTPSCLTSCNRQSTRSLAAIAGCFLCWSSPAGCCCCCFTAQ